MSQSVLKRAGSFAASLALLFTGALAATPAFADEECTTTITSGSVEWGIKESFRKYIAMPIGGGASELNGVTGTYTWPVAGADSTETDIATTGSVHYTKHEGVLDITVSDVHVKQVGSAWVVQADIASKDQATGQMKNYPDIAVANLSGASTSTSGNTTTLSFTGATLTEAGIPAFGGYYEAGQDVDIPSVTYVSREDCPEPEPEPDPETASPSASASPSATASASPSPSATASESASAQPSASASATPTVDPNCATWASVADTDAAASLRAGQSVISQATMAWGLSEYAQTWKGEGDGASVKYFEGNKLFTLSDGSGVKNADGSATIAWKGDFRLYPYGNANYPGMMPAMKAMNFHFADLELAAAADGSGTLTALVSSTGMAGSESEAVRVPIANFPAGSLALNADENGALSIAATPAYEGQEYTYTGFNRQTGEMTTGTADAAWPAEFIDAVDSSLRAYWYKSGANADPTKPPLEVQLSATVVTPTTYTYRSGTQTVQETTVSQCEAAPSAPADPTREGFTFTGWDAHAAGTTFTAMWMPNASATCVPWADVANAAEVGEGEAAMAGVKLVWGLSAYAQTWKGEGDEANIAYDSAFAEFILSDGTGVTDGKAATVSWEGDFRLYPYGNANYPGMNEAMKAMNFHFAAPQLTVNADGSGTLTALVSSTGMAGSESEAVRVPIANFTAGAFKLSIDGASGVFTGTPAYEGQEYTYTGMNRQTGEVTTGTADAAWPAQFIDAVDSSLRAYWYKSGANADATKPPLALKGNFALVTPHTVTYVNEGEVLTSTTISQCDEEPSAPANPEREGYAFTQWVKSVDEATGAVTYTAAWEEEQSEPEPNSSASASASPSASGGASAEPAPIKEAEPTAKAAEKKECTVDPTKTRVTAGSLTWGLRSSFTSYVRGGIAKGEITGNAWNGSTFAFTATGGTYDVTAKTGTIYYTGTAHFSGHNGILDTTIANPRLVFSGANADLYLDVKSNDSTGKQTINQQGVRFATVSLSKVDASNTALSFESESVTLTADGAKAFSGFYSAGEALDNLSGSATLTPDSSCDPVTGDKTTYDAFGNVASVNGTPVKGALSKTGAQAGGGLLVGAAMLVGGLALVRRRTFA